MASNLFIVCLSLYVLLALTPSFAQPGISGPPQPPTKDVTKTDIDTICCKTVDQNNCLATIEAIPESNRKDLHNLTTSIIDVAYTLSVNGYNAIQSMVASTQEPELKDAFTLCAQHYYNAREEFFSCNFVITAPFFNMGNMKVYFDLPKNAILEIKACEIGLQQAQKNSPVTPLTNTNNKVIIASDLVWAVGTYLYESLKNAGY